MFTKKDRQIANLNAMVANRNQLIEMQQRVIDNLKEVINSLEDDIKDLRNEAYKTAKNLLLAKVRNRRQMVVENKNHNYFINKKGECQDVRNRNIRSTNRRLKKCL